MHWLMGRAFTAAVLTTVAGGTALAQESPYRVGDPVELMISAGHWQRCTVVDPGSSDSVMRMRCEPYSSPAKSRAGGIYVASFDSSDVRRPPPPSRAAATPARGAAPKSAAASAAS